MNRALRVRLEAIEKRVKPHEPWFVFLWFDESDEEFDIRLGNFALSAVSRRTRPSTSFACASTTQKGRENSPISTLLAQGLASAPRRTLPAPRAADRGAGREEPVVFDGAPDRRR